MQSSNKNVYIISPYAPVHDGLRYYTEALVRGMKTILPTAQVSVLSWNYQRKLSRFFAPFGLILSHIKKLLSVDVMHVQYIASLYLYHLLPILLARRIMQARTVLTIHETNENSASPWLFSVLANWHMALADRVIVHSAYHKEQLPEQIRRKTTVIPHGVPDRPFPVSPRSDTKDMFTFLLIGFIVSWKGAHVAVEAVERLRKEGISARLRIMGQIHHPSYFNSLEKNILDRRLAEQVFLEPSFVPEESYWRAIDDADVLVLPYERITMSGVLNSAIAAGKPVIMSDLPPFREQTISQGIYVTPGNPVALAESMRLLMEDGALYERQVQLMALLRDRYAEEQIAEETVKVYQSL